MMVLEAQSRGLRLRRCGVDGVEEIEVGGLAKVLL